MIKIILYLGTHYKYCTAYYPHSLYLILIIIKVESQSLLSVSPSSYSSREDYQDLAQVKWGDGRLSSLCSLGARNDDNIRGYQTSSQGAPETQSLDDDSQIERNNDKGFYFFKIKK